MPLDILLIIAAAAFVGAVVMVSHRSGNDVMTFAVGASAGLVDLRIGRFHVFTILVVLWLIPRLLNRRAVAESKVPLVLIGCSATLATSALLGDLVNSNSLVIQLMVLTLSSVILALWVQPREVAVMLRGVLTICTFASVFAMGQVAGIIPVEVWHAHVSSIGRPVGIYPEPDWLGLFSAIGVVLAWRSVDQKRWLYPLVMINGAVFVLAFARAAWVAAIVAVVVYYAVGLLIKNKERSVKRRGRAIPLVLVALIFGGTALAAMPALRADLTTRLARTVSLDQEDASGKARIQQTEGLLFLASESPWHGRGLSAAGRVGVSGLLYTAEESQNNVASNWILGNWVDGRFLALPFMAFMIGLAAITARTLPGQILVIVLVNSFFSNATYFPIAWIAVGLALTQISASARTTPSGATSRTPDRLLGGHSVG
ncbi:hypothetical protein GEV27_00095 [Aeromicrobium sp. S22]|uniref:O-antigen ligase family protein n=1 Tax=Aeromicrobium sp. S22 TaxID=2662029 RepID=UPI00129E2FFA|nr:O-antigen ligase family protein [Aeromicrobium sp. S22]MRJ99911.1 hypothetical protein [Aeromicrobium sp. S22]